MKRPSDVYRLEHMLEHAREAVAMAAGRGRADLRTDRGLELSLVRLVEVIGEAASQVSEETRVRHPHIVWRAMVGMRHRLIHGYDYIDLDLLWDTVTLDLPVLVRQLEDLLGQAGP